MKLAVTDSDSALGAALSDLARSRGHDVVAVPASVSAALDGYTLAKSFDGADAVVHLNQALSNARHVPARLQALRAAELTVEMALHHGVETFAHLSSFSVYGTTDRWPIDHTTPLTPSEPIGRSHKDAEGLLSQLASEGGQVRVIRAAQRLTEPVSELFLGLLWGLSNRRLQVWPTSLSNRRQFASDRSLALTLLGAAEVGRAQPAPTVYHVGARVGRCLADDLNALAEALGLQPRILRPPSPLFSNLWASRQGADMGDLLVSAMDTFNSDMVLNTHETMDALNVAFEDDNIDVLRLMLKRAAP